jgi:hypothetical protein
MPRLRIELPAELGNVGGNQRRRGENRSRPLGAGLEGADDRTQRVLRWYDCWAKSKR